MNDITRNGTAQRSARERLKRGEAYFVAVDLVTVLEQIADPSYVGNYDDAQTVEIYRKWAQNALAGAGS